MVAYQLQKLPTVSLYATSHLDLLISPSNSSALQDMGHYISVSPLVVIIHQPACINIGAICSIAITVKQSLMYMKSPRSVLTQPRASNNISNTNSSKMSHDNKHCLYHPNSALRSSILPSITLLHPCTTRKELSSSVIKTTG